MIRKIAVCGILGVLCVWYAYHTISLAPAGVSPVSHIAPNTATPLLSAKETSPKDDSVVPVVRVVDGDTIVVSIAGHEEKVRLLGVDTPETVDPRKPVQCFGREASAEMKRLVGGLSVRLVSDPSQGDRDKYGRLLRYIYLADGTFVNQLLITEGYAHEYTYHLPYKYQSEFKSAESEARRELRGLWAPEACQGMI